MACSINERFGHNYINGICLVCGRSQRPVHKVAPMPNLFKDLCNRKKISPNSGHQLAGDLVDEFGGNFGMYMAIIKKVGEQQVREWASEARQAPLKFSKIALIMSSYKKFMSGIKWSKV